MTRSAARRTTGLIIRLAECLRMDARLVLRAIAWRLVLPILKHVIPLRTLARWMSATPPASSRDLAAARQLRVHALREMLVRGGRLVISGNCLERSLVLYRFLGEVGAAPGLVMGVNKEGAAVEGHAWIELDGEPLADETARRFVPVMVFEAGGSARPLLDQCASA
jgi:hypothetical protein